MTSLYAYVLAPVVSVALLLFFTALLRTDREWGLAAFCGTTALWSASLLATYHPDLAPIGRRLAASGALVAAAYLHAGYDFTDQASYLLVWIAYLVGGAITAVGAAIPGVLYDPVTLSAGPMFWPAMGLAVGAATIPIWKLGRAFLDADAPERRRLIGLLLSAGLLGYIGSWWNAVLLARGRPRPWGILMVLGSLILLAWVVRARQSPANRRLMERSLSYAAVAAFLSAGFLFGVLSILSESAEPLLTDYRLGGFFLVCLAALAFEPLRQHLQSALAGLLAGESTSADEIADELAEQERRADHAERLAELGTFTSAIAHEVRNPLGVLRGCLRVLERREVAPETVAEMEDQIERASDFLDELLAYGRPRSLEIREVPVADTIELAVSSATRDLTTVAEGVEIVYDGFDDAPVVEADQGQLRELFVALVENALLELHESSGSTVRISFDEVGDGTDRRVAIRIEDDGPGIPAELRETLFEPFVTGRKRDGPRTGTGLGLALARRIAERHGGSIAAGDSALGGAAFRVELPVEQGVLGTAASPETTDEAT